MNKGAYTIKGVDGYHTSSEKNCLAKANNEALKTGQPVRVLLNGDPFMAVVSPKYKGFVETSRNERLMYAKRNIFFEPKDTNVKVYTDTAAKYYDLKKYNNANFKRLSFR